MRLSLQGLSIADTTHPIATYDQLGGTGCVRNKALAIPGHVNGTAGGPWASIEYVCVDPIRDGEVSSVGTHTQSTDEIYYILAGSGTLTTNGIPALVSAGWLVVAPRGTTHSICNNSPEEALSFLVVELFAPGIIALPPTTLDLRQAMRPRPLFAPVRVAGEAFQPRVAVLDLQEFFLGPWGELCLVELPPGARVEAYCVDQADQLLLLSGFTSAAVSTGGIVESKQNEEIQVDATGEAYHCLVVPPGLPRRIENRASGNYPAYLLCLNVMRQRREGAAR